jgi:hypothetical protein
MEPMKILFGYVVKGFAEWFTQNRVEIELAYKESEAESVFETLEDFAVELCLEMRGVEIYVPPARKVGS